MKRNAWIAANRLNRAAFLLVILACARPSFAGESVTIGTGTLEVHPARLGFSERISLDIAKLYDCSDDIGSCLKTSYQVYHSDFMGYFAKDESGLLSRGGYETVVKLSKTDMKDQIEILDCHPDFDEAEKGIYLKGKYWAWTRFVMDLEHVLAQRFAISTELGRAGHSETKLIRIPRRYHIEFSGEPGEEMYT